MIDLFSFILNSAPEFVRMAMRSKITTTLYFAKTIFLLLVIACAVGCTQQKTKTTTIQKSQGKNKTNSSAAGATEGTEASSLDGRRRVRQGIAGNVDYPKLVWSHTEYYEAWVNACLRSADEFCDQHELDSDQGLQIRNLFEKILVSEIARQDATRSAASAQEWRALKMELAEWQQYESDPVYLWIQTIVLAGIGDFDAAARQMDAHLSLFDDFGYSTFFQVLAELKYYEISFRKVRPARNPLQTAFDETLVKWLKTDFQLRPLEHRFIWKIIEEFTLYQTFNRKERLVQVLESTAAVRPLPTWVRSMLQGALFAQQGWEVRGRGFADTVERKDWVESVRLQELAAGYFKKALESNPNFPEPAAAMIEVARQIGGELPRDWFDRSRAIQFDYLPAYESYRFGLLPRWGGSTAELIQFAMECYESKRFDTPVPYLLFDTVALAKSQAQDYQAGLQSAVEAMDSPGLVQAFQDCGTQLAENCQSLIFSRECFLTLKGFSAFRAGDFETARKTFEILPRDDVDHRTAFHMVGLISWDLAMDLVFAVEIEPTDAKMVYKVITTRDSSSYASAIKICDRVIKDSEEGRSQRFFLLAKRILEKGQAYKKGEQITLDVHKGLPLWYSQRGIIDSNDSTTIELDTRIGNTGPTFYSLIALPGAKRIEFEVQVEPANRSSRSAVWGVSPGTMMDKQYRVGWNDQRKLLGFGREDVVPILANGAVFRKDLPRKNRVQIDAYDKFIEVFVDGCFLLRSCPESFRTSELISFGGLSNSRDARCLVRFSNIRVQRLMDAPPVDLRDNDQLIAYYSKKIEKAPKDPWPYTWRGLLRYRNGDYAECIRDLETAMERDGELGTLASFIGSSYDFLGKTEEAIPWYLRAINESKNRGIETYHNKTKQRRLSHGVEMADAAIRWLAVSRPELFSGELTYERENDAVDEDAGVWWARRLSAQYLAEAGDFEQAIQNCTKFRAQIPAEYIDEVERQVDAYRNRQVYRAPSSSRFHFAAIARPEPYPIVDEVLDPEWIENWYR